MPTFESPLALSLSPLALPLVPPPSTFRHTRAHTDPMVARSHTQKFVETLYSANCAYFAYFMYSNFIYSTSTETRYSANCVLCLLYVLKLYLLNFNRNTPTLFVRLPSFAYFAYTLFTQLPLTYREVEVVETVRKPPSTGTSSEKSI